MIARVRHGLPAPRTDLTPRNAVLPLRLTLRAPGMVVRVRLVRGEGLLAPQAVDRRSINAVVRGVRHRHLFVCRDVESLPCRSIRRRGAGTGME